MKRYKKKINKISSANKKFIWICYISVCHVLLFYYFLFYLFIYLFFFKDNRTGLRKGKVQPSYLIILL